MPWSFRRIALPLALALVALGACTAESPLGEAQVSRVSMRFLTPATVRSLVVQVSGAGIAPAFVLNIPVNADSVAIASLAVPAGSARRLIVTAVDTAGVETHRADTTIALQPGANPNLTMRLEPLPSTLGITVGFGGVQVTVSDTSTRLLIVGDTLRITASARRANGTAVPADSLLWGSTSPSIATVVAGVVSARDVGAAHIVVSYGAAAAVIPLNATAPSRSCQQLLMRSPATASGTYVLYPDGTVTSRATAFCDMTTDGGGWTRVLGVAPTASSPAVPPLAGETLGLQLASQMSGALTPQSTGALMQRIGATEMRWLCVKETVGRTFHIKTASPSVIAYYTGASETMPLASGTFARLSGDNSILGVNASRWGRIGSVYETGTWGHEAIIPADRFFAAGPFIRVLAHWSLLASRYECDDYLGSGRAGSWQIFVR